MPDYTILMHRLNEYKPQIRKVITSTAIWLTLGVILIVHFLSHEPNLHIVNPIPIYLIVVTFIAFRDGWEASLVSAAIFVFYSLYFYSSGIHPFSYTHANAIQFLITSSSIIAIALMTGWLKWRQQRAAQRESEIHVKQLQEGRVSLFANAIPHLVWTTTPEGKADFFNEQWHTFIGLSQDEQDPQKFIKAINPEDLEKARGLWKISKQTGERLETEYRIRGVHGQYRWFLVRAVPLLDSQNKIIKWFASATDIHEKKLAEQAQEDYYQLLEHSPQATAVHRDGVLVYVNGAAVELLRAKSKSQLLGRQFFDFLHPDYHALVRQRSVLVQQERKHAEKVIEKFICLDNSVIDVEVTSAPVAYEGKISSQILMSDVTQKHRAEEELRKSKEQLEIILSGVADAITVQDSKGSIVYANDLAAKILGFVNAQEFLHASSEKILSQYRLFDEHGNLFPSSRLPGRIALEGGVSPEVVVQYELKDSHQRRWSAVRSKAVLDALGKPSLVVNIFRDITEVKERQRAIDRTMERNAFLAKSGDMLNSSLDYRVTLRQVAELAVPALADWAAVDMLNDSGTDIERLAVIHQDPVKIQWAYELQRKYPVDLSAPTGLAQVIRTGKSEFYPLITKEMLAAGNPDKEQREIIEKIGFTALMIVPLKILEKTIGAITFVSAESGIQFDADDLHLAEELGRRASLAIYNAQLFAAAESTARKAQDQAALFDTILNNAPIGFVFLNRNFEYVLMNKHMQEVAGVASENAIGKPLQEVFPDFAMQLQPLLEQVVQTGQPVLDKETSGLMPQTGNLLRHWRNSFYPVRDPEGALIGVGILVLEITDQKTAEKEIYYRAHYDALTEMPNRKSLEEYLLTVLDEAQKENSKFAVLFIDLDRLKTINDSLGHDAGDAVLVESARRFSAALRTHDMVARWGGDEFVVLLPNVYGVAEVQRVAQKLLASMELPFHVGNQLLHVTASIGIAMYPTDGVSLQAMQKNADNALYRAKKTGKNKYELYRSVMNEKAEEELILENELRRALRNEEFTLLFQPIIYIKSNAVVSAEALVRWDNPRLGKLPPAKFIPLAEELGLIVPLGTWIFKRAAEICKEWQTHGLDLRVNVNVSPRQFLEKDIVPLLIAAVDETGIDPTRMEIELTESIALENIDITRNKLQELSEKGLTIVIDDFGTGYSSLSYLKRFPISRLKIDKSFVRHMITDEQDANIIRAIIAMAQSLNLKIVAEGVDTETQLQMLKQLGCNMAQGFYISKPLTHYELFEWAKKRNSLLL